MTDHSTPKPSLLLFAHLVSAPDDEIDLAEAAFVFAEGEYPGLELGYYMALLDDLGGEAERVVEARASEDAAERMRVLLEWLYRAQGFRGNAEAYYDPRNSYLNEVLDRKKGIPISLALVLLEVASRAGIEAQGLSFPGHFLVRAGEPERPIVVDPFHGRILGQSELDALTSREPQGTDPRKLAPCSKRMLLFRMLSNLRSIHASQHDEDRLRSVLEHLVTLAPASQELARELEKIGGGARVPVLKNMRRKSSGRSLN